MSLNHLVTGGQAPPQDITVKNLTVEGTITGGGVGNDTSGAYVPNAVINSPGTGASISAFGHVHWIKIGNEYSLQSYTAFNSGIGAKEVTLTLTLFPGIPNLQPLPTNLTVTVNCDHQTGAGPWERLVTKQWTITEFELSLTLVRPEDTNFPASKQFFLSTAMAFTSVIT